MLSKFSNIATVNEIEGFFGLKLENSNLYTPKIVIHGLHEATVCVITSEDPNKIQFAIWGICPKGFEGSWKSFQSVYNTLEIEYEAISETSWLFESIKYRRCMIVATGYFTSSIKDDRIYHLKHELKTQAIFCFAGIYNILEDGFITCSILSHTSGSTVYHLRDAMPIILKKEQHNTFLKTGTPLKQLWKNDMELEPEEFKKESIKDWDIYLKENRQTIHKLKYH